MDYLIWEKKNLLSDNICDVMIDRFEKDSTKGSFEISYKITTKKDSISYQFFEDYGKKETRYVKDNQINR